MGTERDHPHDREVILGGSAASTHQQSTRGAHPAADLVHDEVQVRPVTDREVTVRSVTVREVTVRSVTVREVTVRSVLYWTEK